MKKNFDLLFKVCLDEIAALASCPRKTARREMTRIYREALSRQKPKRRKVVRRIDDSDRCGW